jgi:hypothetical protein
MCGWRATTTCFRSSARQKRYRLWSQSPGVVGAVKRPDADGFFDCHALVGTVLAVVGTLSRHHALVTSLLFGVKPADPLSIGLTTILMIAVAAVGSFPPARRASHVDPMVALRYE